MKKLFLLLTIITTFSCCNKNDDDQPTNPIDQLPPATQTGANTFGCLINGDAFIVSNTSNQVAIYQGGGLLIGGQKDINNLLSQINMFISESIIGEIISENNTYILNTNSVPKGEYYTESQNCFYFTSNDYTGGLSITRFDNTNFIVSGTFEFKSKSDNCEGIINITNGRFDLQYIP
ncbi:hypothetical protein ES676_02185 [Bizionia saleffrena]|uniref:Lipoprotein n=1 Tax=Bizionia saleffrena TaxID=291189 RepID=A0A8H2QFF1_9FLAO|nr:DUF6252 family protein [Bizionia saleffrena]TYB78046.1 hypothetical protein ES676_02185 [Bizionia saleffrena]